MAKFNIDYADRPVNVQSTAAYARPQTQAYEAIAQAGQGIFQIGSELQQRQIALDYSEGQRRIGEQVNAAMDSLTGNEENDTQIWEKLQQDIDNVQYKNNKVNNALQIYRNRAMPDIQRSLNDRHRTLLRQNIHDQFEAEGQTFLAKGDLIAYQNILDRRLASKDISQAEYDAKSKTALSDSLLQQARDLMGSDNPADRNRAVGILRNVDEAVELSTEQKEYRRQMLKLATKISEENADAAIASVVVQKDNLKNAPVLEKQQAAQQMKQALIDGGVTGDQLSRWFDNLNEWSGGDKDATELYDPKIYAGLQATCDLSPESITEGQIYSFVGQGADGGITIQQARSLAELRQRNIDDVGKVQNEFHRRYQDILKGLYNAEIFGTGPEAATQYAETANRLTIFANTNKDATAQDYEKFFADLTAESEKRAWWKVAGSWLPPFSYFKALGVAAEGRETLAGVDAGIKRITGVHERILTEAWQRRRERQIGRIVTHNGQRWRLVKRGDSADQDIYERVE
jgi:hypothetical protein